MTCLREIVPDVEEVSVDEAYADLTSLDRVYRTDYTSLAARIRETIRRTADIPVSIGLGPSKLLAKLASDKAKNTGGIFRIFPDYRTVGVFFVFRSSMVAGKSKLGNKKNFVI